jgi:long-chain acyl-CoA synthetase
MDFSTVADVVRTHGRERPDSPALLYEGRTVTYGELDARSNRMANALAAAGVGAGDRVGFLEKNSIEYFDVVLGLAKLGAVCVAVNWRLAPPEVAQIVNDAQAEILFVGHEFFPCIERVERELSTVTTVVAIGEHERWTPYEAFVESGSLDDPGYVGTGSDVALQLYTSGTTGLPKGVMLTNDNFFLGGMRAAATWGLDSSSVDLVAMPVFHIAGAGWALMGLTVGSRVVVLRDVDPVSILAAIEKFGVTHTFLVPAVIRLLVHTPGADGADCSTLQLMTYGASPITDTVLVRAMEVFDCDFVQLYGLTETTGTIVQLEAEDHDLEHRPQLLRSCGKPYPWVEMRVVDPDTGRDVSDGEIGELWTRSAHNFVGYWANEEATAAALDADGWFRTGDAGYRDADGYLFLHDRLKDMIVSGAENVYPAEIENVLAGHPAVADVAVIGVPDERWGEAVKAIVVVRDGCALEAGELIDFARPHLGSFKLPKSVDFTDALPRNPSGKLLKRELRSPYWEGRVRQIN